MWCVYATKRVVATECLHSQWECDNFGDIIMLKYLEEIVEDVILGEGFGCGKFVPQPMKQNFNDLGEWTNIRTS